MRACTCPPEAGPRPITGESAISISRDIGFCYTKAELLTLRPRHSGAGNLAMIPTLITDGDPTAFCRVERKRRAVRLEKWRNIGRFRA